MNYLHIPAWISVPAFIFGLVMVLAWAQDHKDRK